MTAEQDKRLEKIRALLAKAERTNHPEEAHAFSAKAQELMTKWAIDEAMLARAKGARSTDVGVARIDMAYSPYQGPREQLLMGIARNRDCRVVFFTMPTYDAVTGKRGRVSYAEVVGFPQDLEFVQMLYTSLLLQAEREFRGADVQAQMAFETSHPGHRIRWRNDFMLGYARAVATRLYEQKKATEKKAEVATPGVALVLADRSGLVQASFDKRYPELSTKRSSSGGGSAAAQALGREAGARSDLGNAGVGGTKGALR